MEWMQNCMRCIQKLSNLFIHELLLPESRAGEPKVVGLSAEGYEVWLELKEAA